MNARKAMTVSELTTVLHPTNFEVPGNRWTWK